MAVVREPAVAGRFYPASRAELHDDVLSYLAPQKERGRAMGCMVPHAGYIYSGQVAGAVFSRIEIPNLCLLLCPNHTGRGHPLAIMREGEWRTPLGTTAIDPELAEKLMQMFPALSEDSAAHQWEHAIEVELPFLQVLKPGVKFGPVAIGTGQHIILHELGEAIARVIQTIEAQVLIVASSDMNHYEDDVTTRVKDHKAIERILALDPVGLYQVVMTQSISMCGFGPAVSMLTAANRLGAKKAKLIRYATSGDVSGDLESVVGYAGIMVE